MKKLIFISLLLITNKAFAQTPYAIKEQYDFIHSNLLIYTSTLGNNYNGILNYIESSNPLSGYKYGEQVGFVLESYINMYKTTNDKGYLIKFINEALLVMSWRNTDYKFTSDGINLYMNGLLLWPMAHFSSLVFYEDPALELTVIPSSLISIPSSTFLANNLPASSVYTYGYIAHWLIQKQVETMEAIIDDHWMGDDNGFKEKVSDESPMAINMQAGFGGALLYLGQLASNVPTYSGLLSYLDKGAALARLYKVYIAINDKCDCATHFSPLLIPEINNSYSWYHAGWKLTVRDCGSSSCFPFLFHTNEISYTDYTAYIEDMSHAVTTLIVPQVANETNLFTFGSYPFTSAEMLRFKNTFTKNIFDGNLINPGFHNAVNGSEYPVFTGTSCQPYSCPINYLKFSSLGYMPLYKFDDGDGESVYDIVMNFYANEVLPSPGNISGGLYYNGLSQTVAAQWEKECVNLNLYNRNMVYNQNFTVKNNIVIDPLATDSYHQMGDNSFAEPIITNDEFTVEPEVEVNMVAGESIKLLPGFHAKAGCVFNASIDPNICSGDGKSLIINANNNQTNSTNASQTNNLVIAKDEVRTFQNNLSVFPNPFNESTNITYSVSDESLVSIKITDFYGRVISSPVKNNKTIAGNFNFVFEAQNLAKGIYYCSLEINGQVTKFQKIVLVN